MSCTRQNIIIEDTEDYISNIIVQLSLCHEDNGGTNCDPPEKLKQCYDEVFLPYFSFYIQSDVTDHYTSKGYYISDVVYVTMINYETDTGYIFEDIKKDKGIYIDPGKIVYRKSVVEDISFYPFAELLIEMDTSGNQKYKRTYEKAQSIIANIGGIIAIMQTIASICIFIFSQNVMYTHLSKNVLNDIFDNKINNKVVSENKKSLFKDNYFNRVVSIRPPNSSLINNSSVIKDSSFTELPSNANFMYMKKIDKPIKINDEDIQDKKIMEKRRNTSGKSQSNF